MKNKPYKDYKYCASCKEEKKLSDFYRNKSQKDGKTTYCKNCCSERRRLLSEKRKLNAKLKISNEMKKMPKDVFRIIINGVVYPYFINKKGDIFSIPNREQGYKIVKLKQHLSWNGYPRVGLSVNRKNRIFFVHRIIAEMFIPNPNNYPSINHINGIKTDNRVENLEWCTYAQNTHHAVNTGLLKSPLNTEKVKQIKELIGKHPGAYIAQKLGASQNNVSQIKKGRIWKE